MMRKLLSMLGMLLLFSATGFSQAPGFFNYQGVARNSVGNVLQNKAISLRLTIHDGAASGPVVYQESRAVTTNPFGLFNVQVGSSGATNVTGTIAGVNWAVGTKFIQVEIDPNAGNTFINIGTAQLASVPYALFSASSGDLVLPFNKTQADAGTLFKITNSGSGVGSTALEGLTNSTAGNANAIIGTVTSASPGGFSAGVRGVNNGTGGLGIGVYGSQAGSGWGVYGTAPGGIGVNGLSNTGTGLFGSSNSGTGVYGSSSTGRSALFENTNGANTFPTVTINTASANAPALSVSGPGIWGSAIGITNSTSGMEWRTSVNGTTYTVTKIPGSTFSPLQLFSTGGLDFSNSAGTSIMRLLDNTNVGIGTITPQTKLHVNPAGPGGIIIGTNSAAGGFTALDMGVSQQSGGYVYLRAVRSSGSSLGDIILNDGGGNVGIGTIAPTTKLQVNGTVRIVDGTQANNFILRSDATGTANWADPALLLPGAFLWTRLGTNMWNTNLGDNVGVGITTPTAKLQVENASLASVPTLFVNQSNTGNTANGATIRDANTSNTGYGSAALFAQRGTGSLANTYLYTGIATGITGIAASNQGFGIQGTSETGYGVTGLSTTGIAVHGINITSGNAAFFLNNNTGNTAATVLVNDVSTAGSSYGVHSVVTSTAPGGFSSALRGQNNGTGGLGIGVYGSQAGSGWGVYGTTPSGLGVYGNTNNGFGVYGDANTGIAVRAAAITNTGVYSTSTSGLGGDFRSASNVAGIFQTTDVFNNARGTVQAFNPGKLTFARALYAQGSGFSGYFYNNRQVSEFQSDSTSGIVSISTYANGMVTASETGNGIYSQILNTNGNGNAAMLAISGNQNSHGVFAIAPAGGIGRSLLTSGPLQLTGIGEANNFILASDASGNATWKNLAAVGAVSGTGTVNFVPKWTPSGTNLGNSQIFDNGVAVGIGTTSPVAPLNVVNTTSYLEVDDADDFSSIAMIAKGNSYTGGVGTFSGHDLPLFTNNTDRVTIKSGTGFVGINTGSPFMQQHTNSGTSFNTTLLEARAANNAGPHQYFYSGGEMGIIDYIRTDYTVPSDVYRQGALEIRGGARINISPTNSVDMSTGLTILGNGRTGIGLTTPTAKLHISNPATGQGALLVVQDNELLTSAAKVLSKGPIVNDVSNAGANFGDNSFFAQRGNWTGASIFSLPVDAAITGYNQTGAGIKALTSAGTGLFAGANTGVAINAFSNSGYALTTSGKVQIQGQGAANGFVLTSDATGNATWQANTSQSAGISLRALSAALAVPTGTTMPITQWAVVDNEDGGANYNSGTGEYTIPKTGVYQVNAAIGWEQGMTATDTRIFVMINGSVDYSTLEHSGNGSYSYNSLSYAKRFIAGQKVSISIFQNSGSTRNTVGFVLENAFSIQFLHN